MAVSVVEVAEGSAGSLGTAPTVTLATTPVAGDVVLVTVMGSAATRYVVGITGLGAAWSEVTTQNLAAYVSTSIVWRGDGATTAGVVTVTVDTSFNGSVRAFLVRGLAPGQAAAVAAGSGTGALAGPVWGAVTGQFLLTLGFATVKTTGNLLTATTPATGYVIQPSPAAATPYCHTAYRVVTEGTTTDHQMTIATGSSSNRLVTAVLFGVSTTRGNVGGAYVEVGYRNDPPPAMVGGGYAEALTHIPPPTLGVGGVGVEVLTHLPPPTVAVAGAYVEVLQAFVRATIDAAPPAPVAALTATVSTGGDAPGVIGAHTVTIGGVDVSCLIDTVSISHGRDDSTGQPEPSAVTLDLTTDPTDPLPPELDIGAPIVVTTTTAVASTRFVGRVTDVALGWDEAGEDTPDAGVGQIVGVGALADLGRRVVGAAPWPMELDGARVARVMAAAGMPLDPALSDPGTVRVLPRDVDSADALGVARETAADAMGVLWAARDGSVRYADADHRRGVTSSLTLDACDVLVTPTWRRTLDGLVNRVSVGYGTAPDGGGEQPRFVESADASITRYGEYAVDAGTTLADLEAATTMGRTLLARNATPVWVMAALPVDVEGLTAAQYDALLGLDVHTLLTLTGLPAIGTAPTTANLWVEGWHETLTYGGHAVELVVSGYCRSAPPPRWDDMPAALLWGGLRDVAPVIARNDSTNPQALADGGWQTLNGTTHPATFGVPITGHPAGVTTAARVTVGPGYVGPITARLTGIDGSSDNSATRGLGVWVNPPYDAYADTWLDSNPDDTLQRTNLSGNRWTFVRSAGAGTGEARVVVGRRTGNAGTGDVTWVTGSLTVPGGIPFDYFDGATPDTESRTYEWSGDPYRSTSTRATVPYITGGVDPATTWDDLVCTGGPLPDTGRWDDTAATTRWNDLPATAEWDTYTTEDG